MVKLTQQQKDRLRGVDTPYSEVNVIRQTRILGNNISRVMVFIELAINPLTFEVIKENVDKFDKKYDIKSLVEYAEYRGERMGYVVGKSPYFQYDPASKSEQQEIEEQLGEYRKHAEELTKVVHEFVIDLLEL